VSPPPQIYADSFRQLLATRRPTNEAEHEAFVQLLRRLVSNTVNVVDILAAGVNECLNKMERSPQRFANFDMDHFVDAMLSSRIGRRVLAEQHIALVEGNRRGHIGVINTALSPAAVLADTVREASDICMRTYGEAPEVVWTGDVDATIPYIRFHLQYVLLELLKNGMRATVEHHRSRGDAAQRSRGSMPPSEALPPIEVLIVRGEKDLTMRISDRGGGIRHEALERVFQYGYTTAKGSVGMEPDAAMGLGAIFASAQDASRPMAGLGFGAPLSRLYLQYFGGRLSLVSIEGYGTDCHVVLDAVGDNVERVEV
jgi:pyruvate dehydrogenase kinase 2/3/4